MKTTILNLLLMLFLIPFTFMAKTTVIPIQWVTDSLISIQTVKILSYPGDSSVQYLNKKTSDTLTEPAKWIKYNMALNRKELLNLRGYLPPAGTQVELLVYKNRKRSILFGKLNGETYEFWNPRNFPFANEEFLIPKQSPFKPVKTASLSSEGKYYYSEGFVIASDQFEMLKKTTSY